MYKVNGWFPNYGCSSYYLEDGDTIVWTYTCNGLGADVGGVWLMEQVEEMKQYKGLYRLLNVTMALLAGGQPVAVPGAGRRGSDTGTGGGGSKRSRDGSTERTKGDTGPSAGRDNGGGDRSRKRRSKRAG